METRRFILALSLSLIVFVVYVRFFAPQPQKPEPSAQTQKAQEQGTAQQKAEPISHKTTPVSIVIPKATGEDILIETDLLRIVVNTAGGVIKTWELKNYREADKEAVGLIPLYNRLTSGKRKEEKPQKPHGPVQLFTAYEGVDVEQIIHPLTITPLEKGLAAISHVVYTANRDAVHLSKDRQSQALILTYSGPAGILIEKRLTFYNNEYKVDVAINTKRLDGYNLSLGTDFGISDKVSSDASGRVGIVARMDGKTAVEKLDGIKGELQHTGAIEWFGQEDKYFAAAMLYTGQGIITARKTPAPKQIGDLINTELLVREKPDSREFVLYAGPKSYPILQTYGHGLEQLVDYGWFSILAKPMFWLMNLFYSITWNYGIAIILLTIVVRIILFYPSLKSAMAMEGMKAIQPQLTALREKYKKDPPRLNQEMMKLYKEHKVNPVGGCLPMLLQLPFFVALYNVLNVSIELRQAPFIPFWIKDLSVYDPFYILPVLMGVSMVFMMKITATTMDPQQAKIMMYMNVAFIFLFAWLPAGLLLYITLSNVLSIVQQLYVRKIIAGYAK